MDEILGKIKIVVVVVVLDDNVCDAEEKMRKE